MGKATRVVRACVTCGRTFKGTNRVCAVCRRTERVCGQCGRTFVGLARRCGVCQGVQRTCIKCGKSYRGTNRLCRPCQAVERVCDGCGEEFRGWMRLCPPCRGARERACDTCGKTFKGTARCCKACRWQSASPDERSLAVARNKRRYERKLAAAIAGPVPQEVYAAIRRSGPCVYCGEPASEVDHVRPLVRGGWEHESNIVPACTSCNASKHDKLLTEWRRSDRVAHGIEHSPKVAVEYARLTSEAAGPAPSLTLWLSITSKYRGTW